jgi:PBP1b-binding outer membrane lipoprotein LpoB
MKKSIILSLILGGVLFLGSCAIPSASESSVEDSSSVTSTETSAKNFGDLLGELTDQIIALF